MYRICFCTFVGCNGIMMNMNLMFFLKTVKDIFLRPGEAIETIRAPGFKHVLFFVGFGIPLCLLASAGRASISLERYMTNITEVHNNPMMVFLSYLLINLAAFTGSILIGSPLIVRLAGVFKASVIRVEVVSALLLAYTPFWLAQPVSAIGGIWQYAGMLALGYTIFLAGLALRIISGVPQEKLVGFTLASLFILFGISFVIISVFSVFFIFA